MHLILMRHGEAETAVDNDEFRVLTELGKQQACSVAGKLLQAHTPELYISSTLLRARQTLNQVIQASKFELNTPSLCTPLLAPEASAELAIEWLYDTQIQHQAKCMLVVCHMNIIAHLHALLVEESPSSFGLCEARCYQQPLIEKGLSTLRETWHCTFNN